MQKIEEKKHRPATPKSPERKKQELERALEQLRQAGFVVTEGKKKPKDGVYSGIVGKFGNLLVINTKK